MHPIIRQTIGLITIATVAVFVLAGCKAPPPTVDLETTADPDVRFAAPEELSVAVFKLRARAEADADSAERPRVFRRDELGLEGRIFVAAIERGLRHAGFEIAAPDQADLLAFCADAIIAGEYDAYRRVPVYESVHGTIHTRRGFRSYHESVMSEVIVPERRRFVDRSVLLSVHPRHPDRDPVQVVPDGPTEIWIGRIRGRKSVVDQHLEALVRELLQNWGRTETRRFELPRE